MAYAVSAAGMVVFGLLMDPLLSAGLPGTLMFVVLGFALIGIGYGAVGSLLPGLFAAGDLRSQLVRQVTTAVGDATTAAIAAEKYLKALEDTHGDREAAAHEPQVVVGTGGYAV